MQPNFKLAGAIALIIFLLAACGVPQGTTPSGQATSSPAAEGGAAAPAAEPTAVPDVLGSGPIKLVIWHRWEGRYYKAIQQIFADYAIKNNLQIELLLVPDVANKAQLAIPSGQGPDIIAWVNDRIGDSALQQIIQPLDDYGVNQEYLRANFAPVAADAMIYRDNVYGIP